MERRSARLWSGGESATGNRAQRVRTLPLVSWPATAFAGPSQVVRPRPWFGRDQSEDRAAHMRIQWRLRESLACSSSCCHRTAPVRRGRNDSRGWLAKGSHGYGLLRARRRVVCSVVALVRRRASGFRNPDCTCFHPYSSLRLKTTCIIRSPVPCTLALSLSQMAASRCR